MPEVNFAPELIAPCGMNCAICVAYFGYTMKGERRKRACGGCRARKRPCAFIKRGCEKLANKQIEYCFECAGFPCENLKTLDRRYRDSYGMSLIENLRYIQDHGTHRFLKNEQERWKCLTCGGTICVHNKKCYACDQTQAAGRS